MSLERIDYIQCSHCLSLGVLAVGHRVSDHSFQESLQHVACLFVDESRDALDSTSSGQTPDGGLGDSQDGLTNGFLLVALSSNLAEALAARLSFASSFCWHYSCCLG